ncbi:MAG: FitA-like ribbon-helix-helix domain-containing protein [Armatimonadaceae bacterium]
MASITIRNLDEELKQRLRVRAAHSGRSMEEEVREILRRALMETPPRRDLAAAFRACINPEARADMALPPRELIPDPPSFD